MHGGEHNKRLSRLKWLLLDKLSRRCGFYPCNRSTWVPAPGIRNTKTGRGFEASRSCGMAVAMTFEREWHGSDMVTWWQWVMSWFGFTAWKYFTMYWFHGEIHLWHLGNKQPLCQLQKNSSTELKLQCGKASQTSCVLRENFPGKTYHEEGPARQSSNRFHMGENKPSARLIGVVHKHAAPSNPGWKTCTNIFMPLAGWVFLLHKLKHQLRPGLHWYADSFPAPGYRDTTPETLAYGNAMSQEMTLKTKHKWTPNPFLFSVWEGFWFRNLAMTGNPLRICHWYFLTLSPGVSPCQPSSNLFFSVRVNQRKGSQNPTRTTQISSPIRNYSESFWIASFHLRLSPARPDVHCIQAALSSSPPMNFTWRPVLFQAENGFKSPFLCTISYPGAFHEQKSL